MNKRDDQSFVSTTKKLPAKNGFAATWRGTTIHTHAHTYWQFSVANWPHTDVANTKYLQRSHTDTRGKYKLLTFCWWHSKWDYWSHNQAGEVCFQRPTPPAGHIKPLFSLMLRETLSGKLLRLKCSCWITMIAVCIDVLSSRFYIYKQAKAIDTVEMWFPSVDTLAGS